MKLFDFGKQCRLSLTGVVDDLPNLQGGVQRIGWWLNGRLFGWYVSCDSPALQKWKKTHYIASRQEAFERAWGAYKDRSRMDKDERDCLWHAVSEYEDARELT